MATFPLGVLVGIIAVLSLDTVGSLASQRLKFHYARLAPISYLLWGIAAAIASQSAPNDSLKSICLGGLAGFIVGLVDSTLGWWISWHLGPGRLPPQLVTGGNMVRIIFRVSMMAAAAGVAGSLLGLLIGLTQR